MRRLAVLCLAIMWTAPLATAADDQMAPPVAGPATAAAPADPAATPKPAEAAAPAAEAAKKDATQAPADGSTAPAAGASKDDEVVCKRVEKASGSRIGTQRLCMTEREWRNYSDE